MEAATAKEQKDSKERHSRGAERLSDRLDEEEVAPKCGLGPSTQSRDRVTKTNP